MKNKNQFKWGWAYFQRRKKEEIKKSILIHWLTGGIEPIKK